MGEFQGGSNPVGALNSFSLFDEDGLLAGAEFKQPALHSGKPKDILLGSSEAIDLPVIVSRELTQHSP